MIWATVSSRSCFCWLYRASSSLAAENIINLNSVMSMCSLLLCCSKRVLLWPVHSLGKTLLVFALFHSVLQGQICLLLHVFLGMWSQVGLRKHHYEQSQWRWQNSSWAISSPERWCCESAALNMPANLEYSAVATGLEKVSFHSNPKERQCQRMLKLPHNCTHLTR